MSKISFEEATYKGRQLSESEAPGYCGSIDFDGHCSQLSDPDSWVQSSVDGWLNIFAMDLNEPLIKEISEQAKLKVLELIENTLGQISMKDKT